MTITEFQKFLIDAERIELDGETIDGGLCANYKSRSTGPTKKIVNCTFTNGLNFKSLELNADTFFNNCSFLGQSEDQGSFSSLNGVGKNLTFRNCVFKGNINFSFDDYLSIFFYSVQFEGNINFIGSRVPQIKIASVSKTTNSTLCSITLSNCGEVNTFIIRDSQIKDYLSFQSFVPKYIFIGQGEYKRIKFENIKNLKDVSINADNGSDRSLLSIDQLYMPYLTLAGKLNLQFVTINSLNLEKFYNDNGVLRFQGVKIREEFNSIDSDFQNAKFNDLDLSTAKLILNRSYLTEAYFANTLWPKGYLVEINSMPTEKPIPKEQLATENRIKREVYRQLKQTSASQGNGIDALKFFRNEMESYRKYAGFAGQERWWNRLLLWISRWTANYGISYGLPLIWLFAFHFILFGIFITLNDFHGLRITTNLNEMSWNAFSEASGYFFTLLLPTHKMPDDLSGGQMVVDFFMRLFSGYFIYHIIQASRRFVKF